MQSGNKKKVAVLMGSTSDEPIMQSCCETLERFDIPYEKFVMSAHRQPDRVIQFSDNAEDEDFGVIIAGAGMAAHLPGVLASRTILPVIGVPLDGSPLSGQDALYSIVQMPTGIPVATVAIGSTGAKNAAVLALKMLGMKYEKYRAKVADYREEMKEETLAKNAKLEELGYKEYLAQK